MASSKECLNFILEQMSDICDIAFKPMMGEYLLYQKRRLFGGIYDNCLLVKPTEAARAVLEAHNRGVIEAVPYPGAKKMLLVEDCEDCEDREFVKDLLSVF